MQTTLGTAFYLILFDILRCWLNFVTPALRAYRTSAHESSGISPFVAMFCRSPNNLVAHFETDETDDVDLNPLPVAKRDEISERLRERQEIVTKKWNAGGIPQIQLYVHPLLFTSSLLSLTLSFPSLLPFLTILKVFLVGNRVLCSDPKHRKTSRRILPKLAGPIYYIPATVTKVHTSGNFTALNLITKQSQRILATEAKYVN